MPDQRTQRTQNKELGDQCTTQKISTDTIRVNNEGRAEGRDEERFSIARNMKQLGIPVDVIVKSTGLTSGEIETSLC